MHVRRYVHTHTHIHTHTHAERETESRARYSQALSRGFGISDTSTVASTPEVWILAFKDCFPLKKNLGSLEKWLIPEPQQQDY